MFYSRTALHTAALKNQTEVARLLLERGADTNMQAYNGVTPLHYAVIFNSLEAAELLIEKGADVTATNESGSTPLHIAVKFNRLEVAELLIERGANVTATNDTGQTPLHSALYGDENVDVISLLVSKSADIDAADNDGNTPLHIAVKANKLESVTCLVERGASVSINNHKGYTPAVIAQMKGFTNIKDYLEKVKKDRKAAAPNTTEELDYPIASSPLDFPMSPATMDEVMLEYPMTPATADAILDSDSEDSTFAVPHPVKASISAVHHTSEHIQQSGHTSQTHHHAEDDVNLSEVERLNALLAEKDQQIAKRDQTIAKKDSKLIGKGKEISKKDSKLIGKGKEISKKDKEAEEYKAQLASKGKCIYEQDAKLIGKGKEISKKDKEAEENKAQLASKGKRIYEQGQEIVEVHKKYIKVLENQSKASGSENTDKVSSVKGHHATPSSSRYSDEELAYIIDKLSPCICRLVFPGKCGTGFVVGSVKDPLTQMPHRYVLTCEHIKIQQAIQQRQHCTAEFNVVSRNSLAKIVSVSQVLCRDQAMDYAFIKLDYSQELEDYLKDSEDLGKMIYAWKPEPLDPLVIIGHEDTKKSDLGAYSMSENDDRIESVKQLRLQQNLPLQVIGDSRFTFYDCDSKQGTSGSPVFSVQKQRLYALHCGVIDIYRNAGEYGVLLSHLIQDIKNKLWQQSQVIDEMFPMLRSDCMDSS